MPTPSPAIVLLLSAFADPFTAPTWRHALVLLYGTILAPGARTVAAALRAMGLAHEHHFTTDHRVLTRAPWSARALSRTLLTCCARPSWPTGHRWCCSSTTRWSDAGAARSPGRGASATRCARRAARR